MSGPQCHIKRISQKTLGDEACFVGAGEECFYFEIIDWVRKVVLSGLPLFVERGSFTQSSIGTIVSVYLPRLHLLQQKM